jgi:hypothetical protein
MDDELLAHQLVGVCAEKPLGLSRPARCISVRVPAIVNQVHAQRKLRGLYCIVAMHFHVGFGKERRK